MISPISPHWIAASATAPINDESGRYPQIAEHLAAGQVCGIPTETVYGLAGNGYDNQAVAKIFALKGRPTFNPLILHYSHQDKIHPDVVWSDMAEHLARTFWPGPLTLVLNRTPECRASRLASAGLPTLAVRIPAHPLTLDLLERLPFPLAAPSANPSGYLSPTKASHVRQAFSELPVMDGGDCIHGLESTVVDLTSDHPCVLRPGALPLSSLEATGIPFKSIPMKPVFHSPGLLPAHYAPHKPICINAESVQAQEGLLAFGPHPLTGADLTLNLSPRGDLTEAASHFFDYLHQLDVHPCSRIAVMPLPQEGLGIALNDRLTRAASNKNV